ncbi:MAG: signal peptide peptidase SppA [Rubrobacteridae bacterium]|nr:signal peptide peptidase SppA [Rubrobacteridae bacterium]
MKRSTKVIAVISAIVALSLILIVVLSIRSFSGKATKKSGSGDTIKVIALSGAISNDSEASLLSSSGAITPSYVRHRIEEAENDDSVKAVILSLNSPGGSVGASQEIAYTIRDASIPIIIFGGDMIASGGYYISSQADSIVCKPGSLVGSIGVISEFPDLSGLYEKLGIKMQTIKSGKNKDMFSRSLTPEEAKKFQALSDEIYLQFVEDVAEGRKMNEKKVKELATGEVFAATQAKKLGLVDDIGGYQTAIDVAAKIGKVKDPNIEEYEGPTVFDELFGVASGDVSFLRNLLKKQLLGSNLALLDYAKNNYGAPQYRYSGGK